MRTSRILFTCMPSRARLGPLLALADAARSHGHRVAIASGPSTVDLARRTGHVAFDAGPDSAARIESGIESGIEAGIESGIEADIEARAHDLELIMARWLPDLVVHEITELAAPLVATALGVPYADMGIGPMPSPARLASMTASTTRLWAARKLDPDPLGGLFRYLALDPCPDSLQSVDRRALGRVQPFRPSIPRPISQLVVSPPIDLGVDLGVDLAVVGGGFVEIVESLARSRALLIVPGDEDERWNARAVVAAGAGAIVGPGAGRDQIRAIVGHLRADRSFVQRAAMIAAEIDLLPSPADVIETLDQLL